MSRNDNAYAQVGDQFRLDRRSMRSREVAYQAIKQAILKGILGPDSQLIEERLGAVLELSRTPVREALAILEHEGLIESIPYKGLFVKKVSVDDFLLMYEAAGVVEPALAREAARRAGPADLAAMDDLLVEAERCVPDDIPGHLAGCRGFQRRLGECANNPYLTSFLLRIEERSDLYLISTRRPLPPEKMLAAVADRRAILEAIRAGDADAAAIAAHEHARAVRARWPEMYPEETSQL